MAKSKRNDNQELKAVHDFIPDQLDIERLRPYLRERTRLCPAVNKVRPVSHSK